MRNVSYLLKVFLEPQKVMKKRPLFWYPFIGGVLVGLISTLLIIHVTWQYYLTMLHSLGAQKVDEKTLLLTTAAGYIIQYPVLLLMEALIYRLIFTILKRDTFYKSVFTAVSFGSWVAGIGIFIKFIFILTTGNPHASTSMAAFFPYSHSILYKFLSYVDVFLFLRIYIVGEMLSALDSLDRKTVYAVIISVSCVFLGFALILR